MATETRIYRVVNKSLLDSHPPRLVAAKNAAAARAHVCEPYEAFAISALELSDLQKRFGDAIEIESISPTEKE